MKITLFVFVSSVLAMLGIQLNAAEEVNAQQSTKIVTGKLIVEKARPPERRALKPKG